LFPFFADAGNLEAITPPWLEFSIVTPRPIAMGAGDGAGGTLMRDTVRYALPFEPAGEVARRGFVARDLSRIFDHRREAVARRLG
jgi:hypothetical protein